MVSRSHRDVYKRQIIASDQVVKTFADHPITLKTSIKYHKEYDRAVSYTHLGGCDISSDRKRGAILFLFIIPVTWIAE